LESPNINTTNSVAVGRYYRITDTSLTTKPSLVEGFFITVNTQLD